MSAAALHMQTLEQVRERRLRPQPLGWSSIEHELDLPRKELLSYRWLSAAQIKADHPRRPWKAIAEDPTVDLKESTLKTGHASAVLPTGQTWGQFIEAYRTGALARLTELQEAEGAQAAEDLYAMLKQGQRVLAKVQAELERYAYVTPDEYSVRGMKGIVRYPTHEVQMLIGFPGVVVDAEENGKLLSTHFLDWLVDAEERVLRAATPLTTLLLKTKPEDVPEIQERELTPEELRAKVDEFEALRREAAELGLYLEEAAA